MKHLLLLAALALPASAHAESAAKKPRKTLHLEALEVTAKAPQPAFLLLQRSALNFEELQRTESFLPRIIQSAQ